MYKVDEYYDDPDEWSNERDYQTFQETLVKTRGLHNHFWLESQFVDLDGQVQRLTEYKKNILLRKLTKIVNLREITFEWPRISWEDVVFRHISIRQLANKLLGLCAPAPSQLEAALNVIDIPVDPVVAPYLRRNLSGQWPEDISGATILNNVRLRVSATTREVAWTSKVLFRSDEMGNALPMYMTGRTLRRLLVTIELRSQPQYTQNLWVEIQKDRERAETPQLDMLRSLLN